MKVLITGANGFIGKNLISHLIRIEDIQILTFGRDDAIEILDEYVKNVDFIFHLAGTNRPTEEKEFRVGNSDLAQTLCQSIMRNGRPIPVLYTSSIQAVYANPYGNSKKEAENHLLEMSAVSGSPVYIFRLPNVFGKWARPNYNSAVATFCHNTAVGLPIQINDRNASIKLVYIDDVIQKFISLMKGAQTSDNMIEVAPQYSITVGELADQIIAFRDSRSTMLTEAVGTGLTRALYSTYLSYLPPDQFTYNVPQHTDVRGTFVEMLKTKDSGQISFFTAHPGITRGGHYHHSKNEKFLVIKGSAIFRFRHIVSGEFYELATDDSVSTIVETVPGWTHDITNVGQNELIVMLWANEIFDRDFPDTYNMPVVALS